MRTGMKVVAVSMVALIVVLGYLAFVGIATPLDDINDPGDDPTGGGRLPTAYGIIHISIEVDNAIARYTGSINNAYVQVYDFVSFEQGMVYQDKRWDIFGILSDDMTSWVFVKITGPGQFYFEWESEHIDYSLSEWGHEYLDFSSGRCYFWDKGTYYLSIQAFADGPSGQYTIDSKNIQFTVSV